MPEVPAVVNMFTTSGNDTFGATRWVSVNGAACDSATQGSCVSPVGGIGGTLTAASFSFSSSVPSSSTETITLRKNVTGGSTGISLGSCVISAGATACSSMFTPSPGAVLSADTLVFEVVKGGGGSAFGAAVTATTGYLLRVVEAIPAVPAVPAVVTQLTPSHIVTGRDTATGGTLGITLTGAAVFSDANNYNCTVTGATDTTVLITYTSGTAFTIGNTNVAAVYSWVCVGK